MTASASAAARCSLLVAPLALLGAIAWPVRADRAPHPTCDVAFAGDVLLGRGVQSAAETAGWRALVRESGDSLARADYAVVNLESPLAPCLPGGEVSRPRLCGVVQGIDALVALGVDAVGLANNHALDAGVEGLRATVSALSNRGVAALGVEAASRGVIRGERLGPVTVVAANATRTMHEPGSRVALATPRSLARAVRQARRTRPGAPVLVSLHAGRESWRFASESDGALARAAVNAGASAVVFHGAHVVRDLRIERGVPIHLGLGNYLFDQRDPNTRTGAVLTLRVALRGGPAVVERVDCVSTGDGRTVVAPCEPVPTR